MSATVDDAVSGLVEELREGSRSLQSVAWSRMDGGQSFSLASIVLDRAADALEAAEERNNGLRRLLRVNDDPPKPGFHCACAYNQQTAELVEECVAHSDLRKALATAQTRIAALEDAVRVKDEALAELADAIEYGLCNSGTPGFDGTRLHKALDRARATLSNGEPHDR